MVDVSLDAILQAITLEGDELVRQVDSEASAEVEKLLANARFEAKGIQKKSYDATLAPVAAERSRIIQQARLETLQITGNQRESLIDLTLEQVRSRLAGIRSDPRYSQVLKKLLREALDELDETTEPKGTSRLEVDRRDSALLAQIIGELNLSLIVSESLECWGGVVASSEDGKVVVINTVEARLERALLYLRRYLAALFEDETWQISTTETLAYAP